jgi:hypothetical protein
MVSNRRNRERRPGRRPPFRPPRPRILVVCEGEVTEPEYLRAFQAACRNPRVDILIHPVRSIPSNLVHVAERRKREADQRAVKEQDDNLIFDEVWCVFDVDEHPRIPEALDLARRNGISVAMSNPCFELWLLLHVQDCPGPRPRGTIQRLADECRVRGKHINFAVLAPGYEDAVTRAMRLESDAASMGEPGRNPTTGVWRLTRSIEGKSVGD